MKGVRCAGVVGAVVGALGTASGALGQFGGFGPVVPYSLPGYSRHVATGDMDNDGDIDVVVSSRSVNRLSVLFNDGTGALDDRIDLAVSAPEDPFVLADVNGDGFLDALMYLPNGTGLRVLLNTGDGALTHHADVPTGETSNGGIAVGDLDGDGGVDVAVSHWATDGPLSVLLNDGSGTFSVASTLPGSHAGTSIAIGDVDGDGDRDIVAPKSGTEADMIVWLNDGFGSFTVGATVAGARTNFGLSLSDLDLDGDLDLVTVPNQAGTRIGVALGNGNGGFGSLTTYTAVTVSGTRVYSFDIADVDGDGYPDVVALASSSTVARTSVLLNDTAGALGAPVAYSYPPTSATSTGLALGDLDGNTTPDLVVPVYNSTATLAVRFNQTDIAPPGPFSLLSPIDGTANLPLPEHLAWPGARALLEWEHAPGFTVIYTLRVSASPDLSDPVLLVPGLTEPRFELPTGVLHEATAYYWGVTAGTQAGETPSTPGAFAFSTRCPADADGDGVLNLRDFMTFREGYVQGCP